ncbi:unnamed protein product [Vitrella brassicaformis CCMP3155]|uniref:NAD(P)-binding domain-containing protein n=1 Tax=Vitrella brassicaformis (strain CCMP3155) TaxID=1169540 RepID=A0A0G4GYT2_VITBC|nr:unnamed protein product [Vitrella brassicaformis CCMP3155]|eukprot:CEM36100.1 unnamed protein product [Vitrella brassicaformis CCMP3155]
MSSTPLKVFILVLVHCGNGLCFSSAARQHPSFLGSQGTGISRPGRLRRPHAPARPCPAIYRLPLLLMSDDDASDSPPVIERLLIVGASKKLGLEVARQAQERSLKQDPQLIGSIHVSIQPDSDSPFADDGALQMHRCDVMNPLGVKYLLTEVRPDVLISCVGGSWDNASMFAVQDKESVDEELSVDFAGNRHLIDCAAERGDVRHFVLVSAVGASESEGWIPSQARDSLRVWLMNKSKAESHLRRSGLPYTIIRPCPMDDSQGADARHHHHAVLTEGPDVYGLVSRSDVASKILDCVGSRRAVVGKTLSVVDTERVLQANPYVRALEVWESVPFKEYVV